MADSLREQKKQLLLAIERAIKKAKRGAVVEAALQKRPRNLAARHFNIDEGDRVIQKNVTTFGTVDIELLGTKFTIYNSKEALRAFKKLVERKFSLSMRSPLKVARPPSKATKRMSYEDVRYYNSYIPRRKKLVETQDPKGNIFEDGWFSDRNYTVKTGKKPEIKGRYGAGPHGNIKELLKKIQPTAVRAEILAEVSTGVFDGEKVLVHIRSLDREREAVFNVDYIDSVFTVHPNALVLLGVQVYPVSVAFPDGERVYSALFSSGGKCVGMVMPMRHESFEAVKEIERGLKKEATGK